MHCEVSTFYWSATEEQHDWSCAMCLCRKATEKGFEAYGDAVKERPRELPVPCVILLDSGFVGPIF